MTRLVSLVPSSTEILLGLGADVIACTRFCEQPAMAHVGGTKNPDTDAIIELSPDLVVMDREENRREDAEALIAAGLDVFVTDVRTIDDALRAVVELADRLDLEYVQPTLPASSLKLRRRAFVPIWRRPWMTIGRATYGADLLDRLGIDVVTGGGGEDYPTVELVDIAVLQPAMVLVPSEPYAFDDRHLDEMTAAFGPNTPVIRIDGQDLFWWGIRTPAALARLGDALRVR